MRRDPVTAVLLRVPTGLLLTLTRNAQRHEQSRHSLMVKILSDWAREQHDPGPP